MPDNYAGSSSWHYSQSALYIAVMNIGYTALRERYKHWTYAKEYLFGTPLDELHLYTLFELYWDVHLSTFPNTVSYIHTLCPGYSTKSILSPGSGFTECVYVCVCGQTLILCIALRVSGR